MKRIFLTLIISFNILSSDRNQVLLFDINAVVRVETPSVRQAVAAIGFRTLAWAGSRLILTPQAAKSFLYQQLGKQTDQCVDDEGNPMPQDMADWMQGKKSVNTIVERVNQTPDSHQRNFTVKMLEFMKPEEVVRSMRVRTGIEELLRECRVDKVLVGNISPDSLTRLQEAYPTLFSQFDRVLTSGQENIGTLPQCETLQNIVRSIRSEPGYCLMVSRLNAILTSAQIAQMGTIEHQSVSELKASLEEKGLIPK